MVGWCCLALLIRADVASLCARSRGEPSSAHCEQRLSERLTPCPCDPVCACTGMRGHAEKGRQAGKKQPKNLAKRCSRGAKRTCISARAPTRSAASRDGMAGWAGEGGGRFGERREYEAPTLPSTHRQHGAARHHQSQARNSTPLHKPTEKRHTTTQANRATTHHHKNQHSQTEQHRSPPHKPGKTTAHPPWPVACFKGGGGARLLQCDAGKTLCKSSLARP